SGRSLASRPNRIGASSRPRRMSRCSTCGERPTMLAPPDGRPGAGALPGSVRGWRGRRIASVKSTELRPGMAGKIDGNMFVITQFTHVTPGNLRAFIALKIRNVLNGSTIDKRLRSGEEVEVIELDRREMEYLYSESGGHVFMDQENFEQLTLDKD